VGEPVAIEPVRTVVAAPHRTIDTARILLPATTRGAVLIAVTADCLRQESTHLLNAFAEHGYSGIAWEIARYSDGKTTADDLLDTAITQWLADADALLDELLVDGWRAEETAVVGYAGGAQVSRIIAEHRTLGAAVGVGGHLDPSRRAALTPWLGMTAGEPTPGPPFQTSVLEQAVGYPGVSEQFFRRPGTGADRSADFDSRQRTIEWLNSRVAPRPTPNALAWNEYSAS
jgi:carboxymethylenebutenolidase